MMRPELEWLRGMRDRWEAVAHKWNVWVLGYNPERQRELMSLAGLRDADWRTLTALLFSFLGLMTLILLAWSLRRLARPDPVQKAWRAFCQKLAKRGVERAAHEGPRDYAVRAARAIPAARGSILRIGALYIGLRYGAQPTPMARCACADWCELIRLLLLLLILPATAGPTPSGPRCRPSCASWSSATGSSSELKRVFARVKRADPVLEAISRPAERVRTWEEYRTALLTERRGRGPRVLEEVPAHSRARREEVRGGAGIRGGDHRRRDLLRAQHRQLARGGCAHHARLRLPAAPSFFRNELEQYLLFARNAGVDVFSVRGSYAGAIGLPQFMPSSTRAYAVDFDGNGHIDLQKSRSDAIGSVANFLKVHGWQRDADVLVNARVAGDAWRPFAEGLGRSIRWSRCARPASSSSRRPRGAGGAGRAGERRAPERLPRGIAQFLRHHATTAARSTPPRWRTSRALRQGYDLGR